MSERKAAALIILAAFGYAVYTSRKHARAVEAERAISDGLKRMEESQRKAEELRGRR